MLPNLKEIAHPTTIAEALEMLSKYGPKARPIAGGTAVVLSRDDKTETLVDLTRLGLDHIRTTQDALEIECCVTAAQIASWEDLDPGWMALRDAAATAGPAGVRNAETLGGSLAQCFSWADIPVVLLSLGAVVEIAGPQSRTLGIEALLDKHPSKHLRPGEIIKAVRISKWTDAAGAFLKDSDTEGDYALASAAVWLRFDPEAGEVVDIKIALGAVRPLPVLVPYVGGLVGHKPDDGWMQQIGEVVAESVAPLEDMRASAAHRKRVLSALAKRAARRALERTGALPPRETSTL